MIIVQPDKGSLHSGSIFRAWTSLFCELTNDRVEAARGKIVVKSDACLKFRADLRVNLTVYRVPC